ncbi:MAG: methyltransferase domain-containing protein [Alphaproteobacteria bacterium]|nr:methyltransferase domain-containing protein [Alphaproteobacteria bacterium]
MQIFKTRLPSRAKTLSLLDDHCAAALRDRLLDMARRDFTEALWVGAGAPEGMALRDWPVEGDIEHFAYPPASLDLIVVNGTLNRVNDLPGVLVQMRRALKPDGLFLAAMLGGESMFELRDSLTRTEAAMFGGAAARVHPMVDLPTMAGLMQRAGYALPVVDSELKTIFYRQLKTLLHDIRASGEGLALAARSKKYLGKGFWEAVEADYKAAHSAPDGLLEASIEVLFATGWAPAESQQKPLKPGSAEKRLADALGTVETPLPDRSRP